MLFEKRNNKEEREFVETGMVYRSVWWLCKDVSIEVYLNI